MKGKVWQRVALVSALAFLCGAHALPSPEHIERFDYADLARLGQTLDAIDAGTDPQAAFKAYLDGGGPGLSAWHDRYTLKVERYVQLQRVAPDFMRYLSSLEPTLRTLEPRIVASLDELRQRASLALEREPPLPPVSYFVAPLGGGGSVEPEVVMIGLDYYGRNPDAPLHEFRRGFFPQGPTPMQSLDGMVVAIAHETAHYYQRLSQGSFNYTQMYWLRRKDTVLARAVREGCAEFVAELVVGHATPDQTAYGLARERELWRVFREQMDDRSEDRPGWFQGRHPDFPDAPWQIGYFVGSRMCGAYYRSHPDATAGLRAVLAARTEAVQRRMVSLYDAQRFASEDRAPAQE